MARIGRGNPQSILTSVGTELGPRHPVVVNPLPDLTQTTIRTQLVAVRAARQRREVAPRQGWTPNGSIDTLSGPFELTIGGSNGSAFSQMGDIANNTSSAQMFIAPGHGGQTRLVSITIWAQKVASPTDNLIIELPSSVGLPSNPSPGGTVLASVTVPGSSLPQNPTFIQTTFALSRTANPLNDSQFLWIVFRRDGGLDATNYYRFSGIPAVVGGPPWSQNNGTTWTTSTTGRFGLFLHFLPTVGSQSFYGYNPMLGPRRPKVIFPPPPVGSTEVTLAVNASRRTPLRGRIARLGPPVILTASSLPAPIKTALVAPLTRSRRTVAQQPLLRGPVVINPASAIQFGPPVQLAKARRPGVRSQLSAPTVVTTAAQVFSGPRTPLVKVRPRRTSYALRPPTVTAAQTFFGPRVVTVHTRSRPTMHRLTPLAFYRQSTAIRVTAVHTRPRPTTKFLRPPTATQIFPGPRVVLTNPRRDYTRRKPILDQRQRGIGDASYLITNLIGNGGFEINATGWVATSSTISQSATQARYGLESLHVVTNNAIANEGTFYGDSAAVLPGQTYTFAVDVFSTGGYSLRVGWDNYGAGFVYISSLFTVVPLAAGWQRLVFTGVTDPAARFAVPTVYTDVQGARDFYLDGAQLETGPVANPYVDTNSGPATGRILAGSQLRFPLIGPWPPILSNATPSLRQQTVQVTLAHTRPRRTHSALPLVVVTAAAQTFSGPHVTVTRIRPRRRAQRLGAPVVLSTQVFTGPEVTLTHTRPRHVSSTLRPPTAVTAAAQLYAVAVHLTRTRPRYTVAQLGPPKFYAATSSIRVALTRIRPPRIHSTLRPPITLQVFGPPVEVEVNVKIPAQRLRERPHSRLNPPFFYAQTSRIGVTLVHTRPRRTGATLRAPQALQVFPAAPVTLTHTRPRKVVYALRPPTVVRVPSVEQREDTILVWTVRTRPRPTTKFIVPPLVKTFPPVVTTLTVKYVQTRPRPKRAVLGPPTVVIPLPTLQMQTVSVRLTRIRPRHTLSHLAPPTVVSTAVFAGPVVTLTHTRPRPTRKHLSAPTVIRVPSVEQREDTISVTLVRTRPRPTSKRLAPPATLEPYVVAERERTIDVLLTRIRPRRTVHALTAISYRATSEITVTLVRTRPRPTSRALGQPTALTTFGGPAVTLVKIRPPQKAALLLPPTIVRVPSVEQQLRTITVRLVQIRPPSKLALLVPPQALTVFSGPTVVTVKTRPRPTAHLLRPPTVVRVPSVEQRQQTITVQLIRIRPRPTTKFAKPGIVKPFVSATVTETLVRTRPRHTVYALRPPTVLRVPAVEQQQQTVGAHLTRTRPRPTTKFLRPPTVVTTPQPPAIPYRVKVVIPVEPPRPIPHSHIFPPPIVPPAPPIVTAGGGAYRSFKPRLLTADDVRTLLRKHDGILVREQLTERELRMLDEMKVRGYIVEEELSEEEEIEILRMLGWL